MNAARNAFLLPRRSAMAPSSGPVRPTRITEIALAKAKRERADALVRWAAVASPTKKGGNTVVIVVVIQAEFATS